MIAKKIMKKIGFWASFLIFILSFSFFVCKSYAVTEDLSASQSSKQEVSYDLPYPGLLPDSPLYFLRAIRDRISGFLISDSLVKADFDLLQADKRLNAGIFLFNKGKFSLALTTVLKAENYFSEALDKMGEAEVQGINTGEMKDKLKRSLAKHEQELGDMTKKVSAEFKQGFAKEQQRLLNFGERLNN
jgi:hypothetical protein